jgi:hypothetical protein
MEMLCTNTYDILDRTEPIIEEAKRGQLTQLQVSDQEYLRVTARTQTIFLLLLGKSRLCCLQCFSRRMIGRNEGIHMYVSEWLLFLSHVVFSELVVLSRSQCRKKRFGTLRYLRGLKHFGLVKILCRFEHFVLVKLLHFVLTKLL